ncbi:hypothetical protein [Amycolatopsis sp. EV170708-02-1]|uniref:hypothetical protein n=1 Tax=Amycolatopsis sp. EV170708-02-1 TaxID=2919322 RepID=UPI001F0C9F40|nr:hypothetical protein [Amycolatopsis sp. EV170708-02-1]UMP02426.1 hypothetical protein MJQ72_39590 [Amycolatopsis sp. EV170708-02-1]
MTAVAVRLTTLLFRREDERLASAKHHHRTIGLELRQRFGFSLIQAPLRKQPPWNSEIDSPGAHRDLIRTGRPLEGQFELTPLIGHLTGRA